MSQRYEVELVLQNAGFHSAMQDVIRMLNDIQITNERVMQSLEAEKTALL